MKRTIALLLIVLFTAEVFVAAVRGNKALYVGGTAGPPEKTEGQLDLTNEKLLIFNYRGGRLEIPYEQVSSLEYGQKVGRRVGVALTITIWALFSKKRKHFLTIGYSDTAGKRNGAVFELAKGTVRATLTTLEARTGKQVEFESEEARKNIGN